MGDIFHTKLTRKLTEGLFLTKLRLHANQKLMKDDNKACTNKQSKQIKRSTLRKIRPTVSFLETTWVCRTRSKTAKERQRKKKGETKKKRINNKKKTQTN